MGDFKVICVNDKFRPECLPASCWVEKGKVYTVVEMKFLARQRMTMGYKLAELELPIDSPYKFFLSNRFRLLDDDAEAELALAELLKEVKEDQLV
jgi:hypothetical protein